MKNFFIEIQNFWAWAYKLPKHWASVVRVLTYSKFALNLQLQAIQMLKNDVQMLILCLSYFITTVLANF